MLELQSTLFEIIMIMVFIAMNALFVAMEFSIIRVRNSELESLAEEGSKKAQKVKDIKEHIDWYISATQLGITLVNLIIGWMMEGLITEKIVSPLLRLMNIDIPFVRTVAFVIGILTITYFAVTIGEIIPKSVAIKYAKNVSLWLSLPLIIFYKIFKPFIWLFNESANGILRIFGIEPVTKDVITHSESELRFLISEGRKTGVIDSTEHQLIEKIFDFNDKTAKDIMIPRNRMIAIDIDESREKIIQTIIDEGYSRIPVYKETIDNIIGVIYSKDLISAAEHRQLILLQDILRPANFIPETKHIGEILKEFQRKHVHLGIVVNEHGGVEGLITLEDIIEEIVGEIEDEYDVETRDIAKDKLGIYLVNPEINIEEFNKKFNSDIPENPDEYLTLSGFLQMVTGHIPDIYERIDYKDLIFTVMKKTGNTVLQVKIQRMVK
jgi:CBS domain containing-hemolysin-like protein